MELTNTSSNLYLRYSTGPLPAFRKVTNTSLMCSPWAANLSNWVDAPSTVLTKQNGPTWVLPAPAPPDELLRVLDTPAHPNASVSIQSLCLESCESPGAPSTNTKISEPFALAIVGVQGSTGKVFVPDPDVPSRPSRPSRPGGPARPWAPGGPDSPGNPG